jgi:hypothetical protein
MRAAKQERRVDEVDAMLRDIVQAFFFISLKIHW